MSPRPLILLHGWAFPPSVWAPLCAALPASLPVLTPPLPGADSATGPARPEDATDALIAGLRAAGLPAGGRIVLAGWSLGAQIALLAASRHPTVVGALVLIAATPRFVRAPDWTPGVTPADLDVFFADLARDPADLLRRFSTLITHGDPAARTIRRHLSAVLAESVVCPAGLRRGLEWLRDLDLRDLAPGVTQPTLLVHGGVDPLMPAAAAQWLARALPQARLALFPTRAHAPFLADPAAVADVLTRFLAELS